MTGPRRVELAMAEPARRGGANRLAEETSPYLLQHAHNPVDWYPWGDEALDRAAERPGRRSHQRRGESSL